MNAYTPIECAYCGKTFKPSRQWDRFCCPKCRVYYSRHGTKKRVTIGLGDPDSQRTDVTHLAVSTQPIVSHPEIRVEPPRYRTALMDKDIRDTWARNSPGDLEMPDLPAFLKRKPPPDGLGA